MNYRLGMPLAGLLLDNPSQKVDRRQFDSPKADTILLVTLSRAAHELPR
jgi:hypothetical protein